MIHSDKHYWHHRALRMDRIKLGDLKLRPRLLVRTIAKKCPGAFSLQPFPRAGWKAQGKWTYRTDYRSRLMTA